MSENDPILASNKGKRFRLWTDFGTFFEETLRPVVAEFVGTMFFVFIGTMSVAGAGGMLGVATAHGLIITIIVAALADISGGHVNPAVTFALFLTGVINPLNAALYVLSQLAGSITGAALTRGILSKTTYVSIAGGATMLGPDTTVAEGFLAEIVLTSILILTILLTGVDNSTKTSLAPIAIGFAVIVNILAGWVFATEAAVAAAVIVNILAGWVFAT
ncbi:Aquaporin-8-like [Plakobranchus ocellatus]|uniref:Aquaporin-8-like n=1 Tax=Plakobranchus ocellatus TaxID=259542 RepID=A0AAV4D4D3_9GAST|nr:Aquaporin-8-like [Plakobranchus ocellatus]